MTTTEHDLDALVRQGRSNGLHLLLATQQPSVPVVTGRPSDPTPTLAQQQRQGDILLTPVAGITGYAGAVLGVDGNGIPLTTDGHPHIAVAVEGFATWRFAARPFVVGWVDVPDGSVVEIRHLDPDPQARHEPLRLAPGLWEVRQQLSYDPASAFAGSPVPSRRVKAEPAWQHLAGGFVRSSKGWNLLDVDVC